MRILHLLIFEQKRHRLWIAITTDVAMPLDNHKAMAKSRYQVTANCSNYHIENCKSALHLNNYDLLCTGVLCVSSTKGGLPENGENHC